MDFDHELRCAQTCLTELHELQEHWLAIEHALQSAFQGESDPKDRQASLSHSVKFRALVQELQSFDGYRPTYSIPEYDQAHTEIIRANADRRPEVQSGLKQTLADQGVSLARYERMVKRYQQQVEDTRLKAQMDTVSALLDATVQSLAGMDRWAKLAEEQLQPLRDAVAAAGRLSGYTSLVPKAWENLRRHLRFGEVQDVFHIKDADWPIIVKAVTATLNIDQPLKRTNAAERAIADEQGIEVAYTPQRLGTDGVFISHAGEDKPFARQLADALEVRGIRVWLDERELTIGDSLTQRIDAALRESKFGVVILSHAFFKKIWPPRELASLLARETGTDAKVILPVWHGVNAEQVRSYAALLADKFAASSDEGADAVANKIVAALEKEHGYASPRVVLPKSDRRAVRDALDRLIAKLMSPDETASSEPTSGEAQQAMQQVEAVLANPPYTSAPIDAGRGTADVWVSLRFTAREVTEWLQTDCGGPEVAALLRKAGFTPQDAALRSEKDDMRTIAELVRLGQLSIMQAEWLRDELKTKEG